VVAQSPQRVLIDWDWGASGIWKILSEQERTAPAPPGEWSSYDASASERPRPWGDVLSSDLLDALKEWNDWGGRLFREAQPEIDHADGGGRFNDFYARAAELAALTQDQLGRSYEVLFIVPHGAWRWVSPPGGRAHHLADQPHK
jgi:hypothetical protein